MEGLQYGSSYPGPNQKIRANCILLGREVGIRCKKVAFNDYVNFETKVSVRCVEVSVL